VNNPGLCGPVPCSFSAHSLSPVPQNLPPLNPSSPGLEAAHVSVSGSPLEHPNQGPSLHPLTCALPPCLKLWAPHCSDALVLQCVSCSSLCSFSHTLLGYHDLRPSRGPGFSLSLQMVLPCPVKPTGPSRPIARAAHLQSFLKCFSGLSSLLYSLAFCLRFYTYCFVPFTAVVPPSKQ
jgi:hypothetical protein